MGISGSKSKLRKGGSRPEGWYTLSNCRWEERTSQNSGSEFVVFVADGEQEGQDQSTEVILFLGRTDKVGDYVRVDEDGALKSVDDDEEYEIPENSGVGRFFSSLSEHGISDKVMDNIGDKPGGLNGAYVHIIQDPVLDKDGEPKKNDAGYAMTNTVVDKVGDAKKAKAGTKKAAPAAKAAKKKGKAVEEDEEEGNDEDEDEDEESSDDNEYEEDDEEEEDEPAPAPKRRPGRPVGSGKKR